MATFHVNQEFVLNLTVEELRLVLKALGGRLKEEDVAAAQTLGDQLTVQKAKHGQAAAKENAKLVASLASVGLLPAEG